jgi:hypothetical protein
LSGTNIALDDDRLIFNDIAGDGSASAAQTLTLRNVGASTLNVSSVVLAGASAARFQLTAPALPLALAPGGSVPLSLRFNPTAIGPQGATLEVRSDDPTKPVLDVTLRGLGTKGLFGDSEPSLQWILDTYQVPVRVGDTDPTTGPLTFPPASPNDEITAQLLTRASAGPVTIEPIGVFSNPADPALRFGYYRPVSNTSVTKTELFTVDADDIQTLNPRTTGTTSFDPGTQPFGLYSVWPYFGGRTTYSEDGRNTWEANIARRREMRWYPLKNPDGSVVPNAYVMGNEEAANHDMQDGVFIVRNVRPGTVTQPPPPPTGSTTYQAEAATVVGAGRASNQPGFTGTGFVDYAHNSGDYVEFAVNAPSAGNYALDFRYANGGTADRPLELKVNGTAANARLSFPPTGSWTTWKTVTATVSLKAGANAVRLTTAGSNGANLDSLTVRPATTNPPPPTSNVYQAESATRSGAVVSTANAGYTGSGFVDYVNSSGDFIEWTVNATAAGSRTLEFRYANGGNADRPLEVKVNGAVASARVSFGTTGSWTTWKTVRITVTLLAGDNKIRLSATGSSGPNVDSLTLL